MLTTQIKLEIDTREGIDKIHRAWAKVHLSLLEKWDKKQWTFYKKNKDSYFINPWKWTILSTGKTAKEAKENAENIISGHRD